jgi:hypothetical protein
VKTEEDGINLLMEWRERESLSGKLPDVGD